MSHYWAKFIASENQLFRLDTRVYLNDIVEPFETDICIGAVVGKNPGSARPGNIISRLGFSEIALSKDKLLPNVRSIVNKSSNRIWTNEYVQILNLFYLCNANINAAINTLNNLEDPIFCDTENHIFPWVWFVWGDDDSTLNVIKGRFQQITTEIPFFYDWRNREIVERIPALNDFARHTQGFTHSLITPFLASILSQQ